ncbi:HU family DNA-binding protein [Streptomyces sp. NPDC091416]|uniref:HU family DNA-binding protein n=1 Tax=Streptomyces sp. NPDC091416 TaxID=3366003 RepID=UPI00381D4CE3
MNKQQLTKAIADSGSISTTQAAEALDLVLDTLVRRVLDGEAIAVTGFGARQAVHSPARRAHNPQTGERILVPARKRITFRPAAAFTAMARGERPVPEAGHSAARKSPPTSA